MGLLDDAIREHLDLKRRRGADPTEVERAEREALGPVRRAPEAPAEGDDGPEAEPAPGVTYDHEADAEQEVAYHDAEAEPEVAYEDEPEVEPEAKREVAFDHERESWSNDPLSDRDDPFDEPEHQAEPEPPTRAEHPEDENADTWSRPSGTPRPHPADSHTPRGNVGEETVEYDVEEALGTDERRGEGKTADEDVLEETPEFLQDTPDHDRLWFEQRPPKDFDFDG